MATGLQEYYTHEAARDRDYRRFMEEQAKNIESSIEQNSARIKESIDMQTFATVASAAVLDQTLQRGFVGVNNTIIASTAVLDQTLQQGFVGLNNTIVASNAVLNQTLQQGFVGINNTLVDGFSAISNQLGYMSAVFSSGLSRISDNINHMSNEICNRLDAMHNIANNPRLTQARELSRSAASNYLKGFFEEALEDINAAIEKEKTDYFSWFLKGCLYAYGVGEFSNVIDLKEAITAFTQAAKYNSPYVKESQDARCFEAEIYFYLGKAQYSHANELLRDGDKAGADEMIGKAQGSFEKSVQYSDKMLESMFNVARCKVLLGKKEAGIGDLEKLVLLDRTYCVKVLEDRDFLSVRSEFDALVKRLRHEFFVGEAEGNYKEVVELKKTFFNTYGVAYEKGDRIPSSFSEELPYLDLLGYNDEFKVMIPQIKSKLCIDLRDGQMYRCVNIGGLVWMAENLNYKTENSWCYDNDESNGKKYGRLYTWDDAKAACPKGWRLPSREEWDRLVEAAGGDKVAGKKLKSKSGWNNGGNGTDEFGFSALPGGYRDFDDGSFNYAGGYGDWWSATESGGGKAYYRYMYDDLDHVNESTLDVQSGFSARCVEDCSGER